MTEIIPQTYRYINLALFLLAAIVNSFPPQSFSTIAPHTKQVYSVSELFVNLNAMIYPLMYVFLVLPVNFILDTYGIKVGTLIAEGFICVGMLVRLLINYQFGFFLIGTGVSSFGFLFMLNSPNKFSGLWFPLRQIPLVNSLCMFSLFASNTIGAVIPSLFLDQKSDKQDYFNFYMWQSVGVVGIELMMGLFFRQKPRTLQKYKIQKYSYLSTVKRESYIQSMKLLLKNKNYMVLFTSMTFLFGSLNFFLVTVSWQLKAYGIDSVNVGILIVIINLSGMVGAAMSGCILGRNRKYKKWSLVYSLGSFLFLVAVTVFGEMNLLWMMYVSGGLLGLFIFPYLTTVSDFSVEVCFPVGEATATGTLLVGGQFLGFFGAFFITFLFDGKDLQKTRIGTYIELSMVLISFFVLFLVKEDLRRTKCQQSASQNNLNLTQSLISEKIVITTVTTTKNIVVLTKNS